MRLRRQTGTGSRPGGHTPILLRAPPPPAWERWRICSPISTAGLEEEIEADLLKIASTGFAMHNVALVYYVNIIYAAAGVV